MKFLKEDGVTIEPFNKNKIRKAIIGAMRDGGIYLPDIARLIANDSEKYFLTKFGENGMVTRQSTDKYIFDRLIHYGQNLTAKSYEDFKTLRKYQKAVMDTDKSILGLIEQTNRNLIDENSNKNAISNSTVRDLIAGEVSKSLCRRKIFPPHLIHAHDEGLIHIHDLDYSANYLSNCCLINLKDMFENGCVINDVFVETPHTIGTAANIATQIVACVASSQYGGQTISTAHLAPFVRASYHKFLKEVKDEMTGIMISDKQIKEIAKKRTRSAVKAAAQTIQYQLNTLATSNGQTPFVTVYMWYNEDPEYVEENVMLIEEILKQRTTGVKCKDGTFISPAFPKLIYVLDENNTDENSEYSWLTDLAAKCTAKRLVPDYISAKVMKENKEGNVFPSMGCRSFLSVWNNPETGKPQFYGRWNGGVVTVNLVDAALSAEGDEEEFWKILKERCELCKEALEVRIKRLEKASPDVSPILWRNGAIARLKDGEGIDTMTKNGYSTLSLGYIGIHEACQAMIEQSNTTPKGTKFALEIMKFLTDITNEWKEETGYGFSVYGTPAESTTYTLATKTKNRFGVRTNVTDHPYFTNSYHVCVREEIDWDDKIKFESQFQKLSAGGCISYIEIPNMSNNIPAIRQILKYIYDNIMYCELNTKSDYCENCGYDKEILVDTSTMDWYCPSCGCRDRNKLHVTRRTCGLAQ